MTWLLIGVFLTCIILLLTKGGLWDNFIIWMGILICGLLATNYFEPLANYLEKNVGRNYHWFWDLIAFWGVFAFSMSAWRLITDMISKVRVRFRMPVEWGGKILFGTLASWTMVCLVAFSAHLAPTQMHAWNESFMEKPTDVTLLSADYIWMSFASSLSSPEASLFGSDQSHQFDHEGVFRVKYGLRRYRYEFLNASAGPSPTP